MRKFVSKLLPLSLLYWITYFLSIAFWSSFSWRGDRIKYVKGGIIISVALLLSFLLPRKLRRVFYVCGWIAIFFYYAFFPLPPSVKALLQGKEYDRRSKIQVVESMLREGRDAVPFVHPSFFSSLARAGIEMDFFPLSSVSRKETILCNENGYWVIYKSDRFGFRNPDELWDRDTDILFIGDSFAQGWCVQDGKTYIDIIRKKMGLNAITLGMAGNEPIMEYASLREYGRMKKPKIVIYLYPEWHDIPKNFRTNPFIKYVEDRTFSQNLTLLQDDIDDLIISLVRAYLRRSVIPPKKGVLWSIARFTEDMFFFISLRDVMKVYQVRKADKRKYMTDEEFKFFIKVVKLMKEETESWGGKFILVYIPVWRRYAFPKFFPFLVDDGFEKRFVRYSDVIQKLRENRIDFIDLKAEFDKFSDPITFYPFEMFGHLNEAGHKILAETIIRELKLKEIVKNLP